MTKLTELSTYLVANIHIFGYSHINSNIYLPLLSTHHDYSTSLTFCYIFFIGSSCYPTIP